MATSYAIDIDAIIGRIVVDQGLATPEEVQECLEDVNLRKLISNPRFVERLHLEHAKIEPSEHRAGECSAGDYHYFVMEFIEGRTVYHDGVRTRSPVSS